MRAARIRSNVAVAEDSDETPITPRGMAAPPAPRPAARFEGDASRPATIRIEATRHTVPPRPVAPEHDADRVRQNAVLAARAPARRDIKWLLLSQGLLLNAFVILLVFGWGAPLPGRRLLLGGLAIGGAVLAGLVSFALRDTRNASDIAFPTGLAQIAAYTLPATFIAGWIALSIYSLGLPPSAKAFEESRAAPVPVAAPAQVRAPTRTVAAQPAQQQNAEPAPAKESQPAPAAKRSPFKW
jgi:hypothetical protein